MDATSTGDGLSSPTPPEISRTDAIDGMATGRGNSLNLTSDPFRQELLFSLSEKRARGAQGRLTAGGLSLTTCRGSVRSQLSPKPVRK